MKKPKDVSDRELFELTKRGDEAAFSELVMRYESFVFSIAYDVLRDREDAADASQDAFLKLWRTADSWRGGCEVKTWIYRIAKTTALDAVRARASRATVGIDDAPEADADTFPSPEEEVERREDIRIVREAVYALPETYREVLVMREFQSMSYREIAEAADIDIGTVKSRLSRARAELYDIIRKRLGGGGTKETSLPSKNQKKHAGTVENEKEQA